MKRLLLVLTLVLSLFCSHAQDSCGLRVTLLTCAPGTELYSIFGHTAIRVQDARSGSDLVYNYGTFEFGEGAGFYIKFIRGKLPYYLSVQPFNRTATDWGFVDEYVADRRSVWEQEVLLDCRQKQALVASLNKNALPENRQYRYDFLFDNCTTRSGAMIAQAAPQPVATARVIPADSSQAPTFRNLIHEYLDRGRQPWSKLGIDLLLGAKLDRRVSNAEAQFLPEKLMQGFEGATAAGQPLVKKARPVLEMPAPDPGTPVSPLLVFGTLLALVLALSFLPRRRARAFVRGFDHVLFAVAGLIGVLLLFMWLGTDHTVCANNWNLAWALPTHLLAAPFIRRETRWMHWYLMATIVIGSALLLGWLIIPQQLNVGFLPVVLLLVARAWLIILKPHHNADDVIPEHEH